MSRMGDQQIRRVLDACDVAHAATQEAYAKVLRRLRARQKACRAVGWQARLPGLALAVDVVKGLRA